MATRSGTRRARVRLRSIQLSLSPRLRGDLATNQLDDGEGDGLDEGEDDELDDDGDGLGVVVNMLSATCISVSVRSVLLEHIDIDAIKIEFNPCPISFNVVGVWLDDECRLTIQLLDARGC